MAKSVMKSGLPTQSPVQRSYAICVAKPLSLSSDTYGSEQGGLNVNDARNSSRRSSIACQAPSLSPWAPRKPKYQETAAYCHFGREPATNDGQKYFEWEDAVDLSKYASYASAQVSAELAASNCPTNWVD